MSLTFSSPSSRVAQSLKYSLHEIPFIEERLKSSNIFVYTTFVNAGVLSNLFHLCRSCQRKYDSYVFLSTHNSQPLSEYIFTKRLQEFLLILLSYFKNQQIIILRIPSLAYAGSIPDRLWEQLTLTTSQPIINNFCCTPIDLLRSISNFTLLPKMVIVTFTPIRTQLAFYPSTCISLSNLHIREVDFSMVNLFRLSLRYLYCGNLKIIKYMGISAIKIFLKILGLYPLRSYCINSNARFLNISLMDQPSLTDIFSLKK